MNQLCRFFTLACTAVLLRPTASAYIDPSVATYLVQAVAGIGIAVATGAGIYFHKIKHKVNDTLGIQEDSNKAVEEDLVIYEEEEPK